MPACEADKEERGRVLLVAGSHETPGAAVLAATAALRAGACRVTIGTGTRMAHHVALAIPESRVIALPETDAGGIAPAAAELIGVASSRHDAILIGPGMLDEQAICALVIALLPRIGKTKLLLDGSALNVVRRQLQAVDAHHQAQQKYISSFSSPVLLTPHIGELAHLAAIDKESVFANPLDVARQAARRWNALVALKAGTTLIAAPDGRVWRHESSGTGLAVSGSSDILAGVITGLAARGATLEQACVWGVALHAKAGERLASRFGPVGYLASEIPAEIPALMHMLSAR